MHQPTEHQETVRIQNLHTQRTAWHRYTQTEHYWHDTVHMDRQLTQQTFWTSLILYTLNSPIEKNDRHRRDSYKDTLKEKPLAEPRGHLDKWHRKLILVTHFTRIVSGKRHFTHLIKVPLHLSLIKSFYTEVLKK